MCPVNANSRVSDSIYRDRVLMIVKSVHSGHNNLLTSNYFIMTKTLQWTTVMALSIFATSVFATESSNLLINNELEPNQAPVVQTQATPVKVVVKDASGQPIIGATVRVKGTNNAKATGLDGDATISVPSGAILEVAFMGFKTQEVPVTNQTLYDVVLLDDLVKLDEVIVVGYGTQKKANLTGAVSQVSMEKVLGDRPVTSVGAALQGAIPGLVITGGAVPGSGQTFNIRGTTSLNGGGPLILVDNVPAQINLINPEDIETVSVLKDAASAAIYGARGAFGVILITTKKAKKGTKLQLNYNDNFAFTKSINRPEQASIQQILETHLDFDNDGKYYAQSQDLEKWIGYVKDYNKNPSNYPESGRYVPEGDNIYYYLKDNDLQNAILDNFGFQQTHNVSASGGGDKITYRISLGYTNNDGILITDKDKWDRLNVSSYVSADITKWLNTSLDIRYARGDRSYVEAGNVYNTYFPRFYPSGMMPKSTDLDGKQYYVGTAENYIRNTNPARYRDENPRIYSRTLLTPFKGFEGVFEYTFDQNNWDKKTFSKSFELINDQMGVIQSSAVPTYRNDKSTTRYNSLNAYASYNIATTNLKHNFKVMAGYSQEQRYWETLWASRIDVINPDLPSINGSAGETKAGDGFTDYTIRSGYFRFNYDFMDKYLVEILGRYDGSSKFPKSNRFGFFPSGSIGWQLAKEKFMDWSDNWLDEFKIRASWGQVGNQAINDYQYTPGMSSALADWIVDGKKPTTLNMPALVRNNFTWETVESLNFGVDLSLLSNRLQGTFEWYRRDTKGMLAPGAEFPSIVGASAPLQNTADLRTSGWELSMSWRDKVGEWGYNVGFNIFDSQTKITKYDNAGGLFYDRNSAQDGKRYREGMTMGEIWGYNTLRYYTINDFQDGWQDGKWNLKEGVTTIKGNTNIRPGDIMFENLRDDEKNGSVNQIDDGRNNTDDPGDRTIIGNETPRYQFGISAGVNYKGFDLSVFFNGTAKRDAWLGGDLQWPLSYGTFGTVYTHQLDYWKPIDKAAGNWNPQNPDAQFPRLYDEAKASGSNNRIQTKYLANAAYLRLKNVTLSYSVPKDVMSKIGMTGAKIFFSAENIWTLTSLAKGYDPERLNWGYPFYATYSFGINLTL